MDLLTVLAHELGHVIGREHSDGPDVMASQLSPGERLEVRGERLGQGLEVRGERLGENVHDLSSSQLSALRSPLSSPRPSTLAPRPSSSSPLSALRPELDALFARLDEDATDRIGDAVDAKDGSEERRKDDSEDGLDLWSLLYGLD
jgi:hypothetical protein